MSLEGLNAGSNGLTEIVEKKTGRPGIRRPQGKERDNALAAASPVRAMQGVFKLLPDIGPETRGKILTLLRTDADALGKLTELLGEQVDTNMKAGKVSHFLDSRINPEQAAASGSSRAAALNDKYNRAGAFHIPPHVVPSSVKVLDIDHESLRTIPVSTRTSPNDAGYCGTTRIKPQHLDSLLDAVKAA